MASPGVGLDSGPPLPPGLSSQKAPDMSSLAGQPQGQPQGQPGGNSMAGAAMSAAMMVEQGLDTLVSIFPQFAAQVDQFRQTLRANVGNAIASSAQPQTQTNPLAQLANSIQSAPQT